MEQKISFDQERLAKIQQYLSVKKSDHAFIRDFALSLSDKKQTELGIKRGVGLDLSKSSLAKLEQFFDEQINTDGVLDLALRLPDITLHSLGFARRTLAKMKARQAGFHSFVPSKYCLA